MTDFLSLFRRNNIFVKQYYVRNWTFRKKLNEVVRRSQCYLQNFTLGT